MYAMKNFQTLSLTNVVGIGQFLGMRRLFEHLDAQIHQKNHKDTLFILSQAAIRLHKLLTENDKSLYDADLELIKTDGYCKEEFVVKILELKKQNPRFVLFHKQAFQLIYHLMIYDIDFLESNLEPFELNRFTPVAPYEAFSLVGVFLLANEILSYLKAQYPPAPGESAEIRDFYSRCAIDPAGAVGRSGLFYDRQYFNEELKKRFGLSVQDLRQMAFDHFVHILSKDPAIFDLSVSFKLPIEKHEALRKVVNLLSVRYRSKSVRFSELIKRLAIDLALGSEIRGKPLIEANGLYYCLCPELLGSPLADLPHHVILTDMLSKGEKRTKPLRDAKGEAFHAYMTAFSIRELGENACKAISTKKDGEFGDLIIDLGSGGKLMVELKVADPRDSEKKGNIADVIKRFLLPLERSKGNRRNPGPLQVMESAISYRKKYNFTGAMYTAVIYYGWFPEVTDFDRAYAQSIKATKGCLLYEENEANAPTILMNAFTWELILSAVKQSATQAMPSTTVLHSILNALRPHAGFPSRSSSIIEEYFRENKKKFSVAPVFRDQIHALAAECRDAIIRYQTNK